MSSKYKLFSLVFGIGLALDLGTKQWARQLLKPRFPDALTVIPRYFELRYSENTGSAFGLFRSLAGGRYLLLAVGVAALCALAYSLIKADPRRARFGAELGLLGSGTLGNVVDRLAFGRVTDFVVWKVGSHEWPTFNVADAALVVGLALLLIEPPLTKPAPQEG